MPLRSKDDWQRLQGAVVGKILLRSIPFGIQENRAEFERGVVGDTKLPVSRKAVGPGVFKIAGGDGEKFGDL